MVTGIDRNPSASLKDPVDFLLIHVTWIRPPPPLRRVHILFTMHPRATVSHKLVEVD